MISWIWIIPTFLFGGMFGILITVVLMAGNRDDD